MQLTFHEADLLRKAVEATTYNTVVYVDQAEMTNLLAAGLVEANAAMVLDGKIAFRANQAGIDFSAQLPPAQPAAPAPAALPWGAAPAQAPAPAAPTVATVPATEAATTKAGAREGFIVGKGGFVPPVKAKRKPPVTSRKYEFENLELGGYIFVPASEKLKDPKKSLGSTVSSANKRFADFEPRRYFKTYRAEAGQRFGEVVAPADGCYIVRVEPPAPGEAEESE